MESQSNGRRSFGLALGLAMLVLIVGPTTATANFLSTYSVKAPVVEGNLALFPVVSKVRNKIGKGMLLLEQGIEKGLVTVREMGTTNTNVQRHSFQRQQNMIQRRNFPSTGRVNRVLVSNRSDQELFIMGGEVILGGKQDRVMQKDVIIPPHTTDAEVPVFCVEKGRWSGRTYSFRSSKQLVDMKLRSQAMFKTQGQVWSEVNRKNAMMKTTNNTDTYRAVLHSERLKKELTPRLARLTRALGRVKGLAGVIVAINGEVKAVDVFYSPELFSRIREKVVRSYLVEALTHPKKGAKRVVVSDALSFIKLAEQSKKQNELSTKGDTKLMFEDDQVQGVKLRSKHKKSVIHYNFFKK